MEDESESLHFDGLPATNEIDALAKAALMAFQDRHPDWQEAMESVFCALAENAENNHRPDRCRIPIDGPHIVGLFSVVADMFSTTKNGGSHALADVVNTGGRNKKSKRHRDAEIELLITIGYARVRAEARGKPMAHVFRLVAQDLRSHGGNIDTAGCRSAWSNRVRLPPDLRAYIDQRISEFSEHIDELAYRKTLFDTVALLSSKENFTSARKIKSKAPIL